MRHDDPCGLCGRTLRVGDSFHEVVVLEGNPGGHAPGRYNDACGECAGFEYKPPVVVPGAKPRSRGNVCSTCNRMIQGKIGQRLRFIESDNMPFEYGLHAICHNCYEKYKRVVQERVRKPFTDWQKWSWKGAAKNLEVGGTLPTLDQFDADGYERYTDGIVGTALM